DAHPRLRCTRPTRERACAHYCHPRSSRPSGKGVKTERRERPLEWRRQRADEGAVSIHRSSAGGGEVSRKRLDQQGNCLQSRDCPPHRQGTRETHYGEDRVNHPHRRPYAARVLIIYTLKSILLSLHAA